MLAERITSAIFFRKGVYAEVSRDPSFTVAAWVIVVIVSDMNGMGTHAGLLSEGPVRWILGAGISSLFGVLAFVLTAVLLPRLMQAMFNVSVSFEQMVRALGLASIWGSVSVLGMLAGLMPLLACVIAPVRLVAAGAVAITYLIAIQEVSEMNWARTVSVAVFALFIQVLASQIAAVLLASLV
jgi:hypothetical protein